MLNSVNLSKSNCSMPFELESEHKIPQNHVGQTLVPFQTCKEQNILYKTTRGGAVQIIMFYKFNSAVEIADLYNSHSTHIVIWVTYCFTLPLYMDTLLYTGGYSFQY